MDTLIIDDDRSIREAALTAVESLNHDAEAVENSSLALTRLKEDKFDLVILDLMLSGEDWTGGAEYHQKSEIPPRRW